jgi:hypothetical protein
MNTAGREIIALPAGVVRESGRHFNDISSQTG